MPLSALLALEQFTSPSQMPAFYGQSLSLVGMLARHGKPRTLIDFAVDAQNNGYAHALKRHYNIDSVSELESRWLTYARSGVHRNGISPVLTVSFKP